MVSTLHRCSYVNLTISSVNKLKTVWRFSPLFPSFTFLFFAFLFILFFKFMSKSPFIEFPGHQSESKIAYYFQRERERESSKSSREGGDPVVRWCWVNI